MALFKWLALLLLLTCTGCWEAVPFDEHDALQEKLSKNPPRFVVFNELKENPGDDRIRSLLKKQQNSLSMALESRFAAFVAGYGTGPFLIRDSDWLCKVRLELCTNDNERIAVLKQVVELSKAYEELMRLWHQREKCGTQDLKQAEYFMFDSQIKLLRMERQAVNH
jgi:hypothetical protein